MPEAAMTCATPNLGDHHRNNCATARQIMRRQVASIWSCCSHSSILIRPRISAIEPIGRRYVRISSTPSSSPSSSDAGLEELNLDVSKPSTSPDARFEVLGAPFSLLSVQLSPSQNLYTRRGSLVAVSGKAENVVSTLSLLSPLSRAVVGVPFLYQKISSASPASLMISTPSPTTSLAVVHLDGRLDWLIAQRSALLAWTGHNLTLKPRINTRLSIQHWGNSLASGRGLLALVGKGQIYQITLNEGEEYIAHPSHVVAYTQNYTPPQPYRFRATTLKLQIPSISGLLPDTKFFNEMKKSPLWKNLAWALFTVRTWARRSIWGDRLFLQFKGPTTILLQSRGGTLRDSLTREEVNEIADSPAGVVREAVYQESPNKSNDVAKSEVPQERPQVVQYATVKSGTVDFSKSA